MVADGHQVKSFVEKPKLHGDTLVNGGFMVFEPEIFKYLSTDDDCILERGPMEKLALDGQLSMYSHDGFWQCMDTYRDLLFLNELWTKGNAPWNVWDEDLRNNNGGKK